MDEIFSYLFIAFVSALLGASLALAPDKVVKIHGEIGKVLTVEYKQNVYKLVPLEQ